MISITTNYFDYKLSMRDVNLSADTFNYALIGTYALLSNDTLKAMSGWAELSANEITGIGYTTGGKEVSGNSVQYTSNGTYFKLDNISWTSSNIEAYGGVLYRASDGLLCQIHKFNDDGSSSTSITGTFQILWNSSGVLRIYS